jgi:hypothetical protein
VQRHSFFTPALHEGKWLASRSGCFTTTESARCPQDGGWKNGGPTLVQKIGSHLPDNTMSWLWHRNSLTKTKYAMSVRITAIRPSVCQHKCLTVYQEGPSTDAALCVSRYLPITNKQTNKHQYVLLHTAQCAVPVERQTQHWETCFRQTFIYGLRSSKTVVFNLGYAYPLRDCQD